MFKTIVAAAVAAAGLATPVMLPSSARADAAYDRCIDANTTNTAWAECGGALVEREQAALDRALAMVRAAASPSQRTDLDAEQTAWAGYMEAACRYYVNAESGREAQVLNYPACRAGILHARTAQLLALREELAPR